MPVNNFSFPLIVRAITVLNCASRLFLPLSFSNTLVIFASLLLSSPAYLAEYTPGSPPNSSISKPVSSAKQS